MLRLTAITLIIGGILSSAAWAQSTMSGATLEASRAPISVNYGEGYKQVATGATKVSVGARVMAGPGGRGRLVYPDGCVTQINPGSVVAVGKCYKPMTAGLEAPVEETHPPYLLYGAIAVGIGVGICAASGCFRDEDPGGRRPPPKSP
jgi:hypothetical protein